MSSLDKWDKIVAIAGGVVGIVGGLAGGWVFLRPYLQVPETFELIGYRFVDSNGFDMHSRVGPYADLTSATDAEMSLELAFRYNNTDDFYAHPIAVRPALPPADEYFSEDDRDRILEAAEADDVTCYLERIEAAVAPNGHKDLICRTQSTDVTFDPNYGFLERGAVCSDEEPNENCTPDGFYNYWFNACAVLVELTSTDDAALPVAFDFNMNENVGGGFCADQVQP